MTCWGRNLSHSLMLVALLGSLAFGADPPEQSDRLLAKLPGPSGTAAEFSRDGKLILTAGGDEARVWDAETFRQAGASKWPGVAVDSPAGRAATRTRRQ